MKVYYECAPCYLRQAKEALDLATDDEELKLKITSQIIKTLCHEFKPGASANKIGTQIHRIIKNETGNPDPYHMQREKSNTIALKFLPQIKAILEEEPTLENYLKAAIAGNILDFGALGLNKNIEEMFQSTLRNDLAVDDSDDLERELKKVKTVLYLVDNVGEIVFDKLLIEKLNEYEVEVTAAVKAKPILNDAIMEEALEIGLNEVAELTNTGTDSVGVIEDDLSKEFTSLFYESDLIIAKGLGNYEGLTEMDLKNKPVFCLLNAKCEPIAKDIGVKIGDSVVVRIS